MAEWSAAYIGDLPDSAFACVDSGGEKDEQGKTVPRSKRHYPHHNSDGSLDLPHLRNALARIRQEATTSCGRAHLEAHAKEADVGKEKTVSTIAFVKGSRDLIEGLAIPFGGPFSGKDLDGEFFTQSTDLCLDWFETRPLLYHHGLDGAVKAAVIGRVKSHEIKDDGLWVQAQLDRNSKYRQVVGQLIEAQGLGFSSGAMQHLVETDAKTGEIKRWPWVEESLTPTPANPDAMVYAVKSADLIEHLAAIEIPVPSELIASALKALDSTKDSPEHGPFAEHGQRVLAAVQDFVARTEARREARTKADRTLSENDRSVLLGLQGSLWTVSADVDALIRATDPAAPKRAEEALGLMAEFEAIQARLAGVSI